MNFYIFRSLEVNIRFELLLFCLLITLVEIWLATLLGLISNFQHICNFLLTFVISRIFVVFPLTFIGENISRYFQTPNWFATIQVVSSLYRTTLIQSFLLSNLVKVLIYIKIFSNSHLFNSIIRKKYTTVSSAYIIIFASVTQSGRSLK